MSSHYGDASSATHIKLFYKVVDSSRVAGQILWLLTHAFYTATQLQAKEAGLVYDHWSIDHQSMIISADVGLDI